MQALKNARIVKFLISGGSAALIEYTSFLFLHVILGDHMNVVSQTASFLAGFVVSFYLNKVWVFKSDAAAVSELLRYAIIAAINLGISNLFLWILIAKLGVVYWLAKLFVMAIVASWNYVLFRVVVFKASSS